MFANMACVAVIVQLFRIHFPPGLSSKIKLYQVPFLAELPSLLLTQPYLILIMQPIGLELLTKESEYVCK